LHEPADALTLGRMRRPLLITLAVGLALLGLGLLAYQVMSGPTVLRVAVGPMGGEDTRLMAAAAQYLNRERALVRFRLVLTEGLTGSAEALDDDKADLAVVRTDVTMPLKGQTLAILHRDAAVLIAPERAGIAKVADLRGRTVGIVRKLPANVRLLETVLAHYDIPHDSVSTVVLSSPGEVDEALRAGRIDAVLAIGTLSGRSVAETVSAVVQAGGGPPVFVPIMEAEAIAQRSPLFESFEIVRGAFGGTPPRPAESVTTLGVSQRLVAQAKLDDNTVAEVTRLLFAMRPSLSHEVPLANRIEGPNTSKSSSLPVHPGAAAYYDGEVQSFFERYGDWFYLIIMALGIGGSALAGLASQAAARQRSRTMVLLDELMAIVRHARAAQSVAELDALEVEADQVLASALARAGDGVVGETLMVAFFLGLDQARRAIHERRHHIEVEAEEEAPLSQAAE
jgi:TRAP transporter TAXI family solute receptor